MLTRKQEAFCVAYAKSGNATQSAIEAGYSKKTARSVGAENLTKPDIQNRLQELAEEIRESVEEQHKHDLADAAEVNAFFTSILRGELTEEVVVTEGCGNGYTESRLMTKPASLKDRISAGNSLAKILGMNNDKITLEGVLPVVLCDDIGGDDSEN